MSAQDELNQTWAKVLDQEGVVGGQLFFNPGRHTVGEIERVRNYGNRATFHFAWCAAKISTGWSRRDRKKATVWFYDRPLVFDPAQDCYSNGYVCLALKGSRRIIAKPGTPPTPEPRPERVPPPEPQPRGPGPLFEIKK